MIEDVRSGRRIPTEARPASAADLAALGPGWNFNWLEEMAKHEVYQLMAADNSAEILGLMSITREAGFVEVHLLEASPQNVGKNKQLRGIAGSLLALAVDLSMRLGFEGFLAITAKTELIAHYRAAYGFCRIGGKQRMFLAREAAAQLIRAYPVG
jgi:hypothetical protein